MTKNNPISIQFNHKLCIYKIFHINKKHFFSGWLGAASWSISMFTAPIVIAFCRRKSTRLTAVLGGLVLALGILFTSFATQLHQVAFSYGKSIYKFKFIDIPVCCIRAGYIISILLLFEKTK